MKPVKRRPQFLPWGKAQALLLSAPDAEERRAAAVLAIRALSALDENIQQLHEALPRDPKVLELTRLLAEIAPAKMEVIKTVRTGDLTSARDQVRAMEQDMARVEELSGEVVQEEQSDLTAAVEDQRKRGNSTIKALAQRFSAASSSACWRVGSQNGCSAQRKAQRPPIARRVNF